VQIQFDIEQLKVSLLISIAIRSRQQYKCDLIKFERERVTCCEFQISCLRISLLLDFGVDDSESS
jgi:hypothetical protein